jgi:hypothetical protein
MSYLIFSRKDVGHKRIFFFYCLFVLLHTILSLFSVKLYPVLFNICDIIYTPVQLLFFALIISSLLTNEKTKSSLKKTALLFLLFTISLICIYPYHQVESIISALEQLILITFCIFFYYEKLQRTDTLFIYTTPGFWAINAIFIYACGTFFVYLFRKNLLISEDFVQHYRYIHYIISIITNILISICFFLTENSNKEATKNHLFET